jgi:hypothetical protein
MSMQQNLPAVILPCVRSTPPSLATEHDDEVGSRDHTRSDGQD